MAVCTCGCKCIHMCAWVCAHVCIAVFTHMSVWWCVCRWLCAYVGVCVCMHAGMCAHVCLAVCVPVCTCLCTCVGAWVYMWQHVCVRMAVNVPCPHPRPWWQAWKVVSGGAGLTFEGGWLTQRQSFSRSVLLWACLSRICVGIFFVCQEGEGQPMCHPGWGLVSQAPAELHCLQVLPPRAGKLGQTRGSNVPPVGTASATLGSRRGP